VTNTGVRAWTRSSYRYVSFSRAHGSSLRFRPGSPVTRRGPGSDDSASAGPAVALARGVARYHSLCDSVALVPRATAERWPQGGIALMCGFVARSASDRIGYRSRDLG
jgi:hypothetical protein